jgi:hypothetical protein
MISNIKKRGSICKFMSLGIVSRCKIGNLDNQSVFACMLELGSQHIDLLRRDVGETLARDQIQTDRGKKICFRGKTENNLCSKKFLVYSINKALKTNRHVTIFLIL